ncbi:hypothetical protein SeMB42_g05243 [Synchytrium endobioticum]|uniref:Outer dynein arm-docking complex subunit 4 n=1 Tax=Synchytrium endobioticum TaxID=286115 RepID=A0A507CSN9_9FUNG|nr:hypothetical protein SeMB42_g05243 [Synchytrium endobioticum]TPX42760.1 hypothetical protein SeLEV6574_g05433 [Synchytrium endobioticum]
MAAASQPSATANAAMDALMDPESLSQNPQYTFGTLAAEGDLLAQRGSFAGAIEAYSKALTLRPSDKHVLVSRAKCHVQVGSPRLALDDANAALKLDATFFKGVFMKAEALYAQGDFELALMHYHRGHAQRPELAEFRIGIQKAREAIENSVGGQGRFRIRVPARVRRTIALASMNGGSAGAVHAPTSSNASSTQSAPASTSHAASTSTKSNALPTLIIPSPTTIPVSLEVRLLGELFEDKMYLAGLADDKDFSEFPNDGVTALAKEGLRYLNTRVDFWRQQNPGTKVSVRKEHVAAAESNSKSVGGVNKGGSEAKRSKSDSKRNEHASKKKRDTKITH